MNAGPVKQGRKPDRAARRTRPSGPARRVPSSGLPVRRARMSDLPGILALEAACFQPHRRAAPSSLKRSLASPSQSVWVVDFRAASTTAPRPLAALLVLWHFPHRLRVYDVATHPSLQGQGLGHRLMAHTEALARRQGAEWVSLEASPNEPGLVGWYLRQGYSVTQALPSYYRDGSEAVRMVKRL